MLQLFFLRSKQIHTLSDDELIAEYRRTDDNSLIGELFKRYAHLVLGVCLKYLKDSEEARDMTMVVFEKLLSDLKNHEVQHFKSWLYMVAKNQCLMDLRKRKGKETTELQEERTEDEDGDVESGLMAHLDDSEEKEVQLQQLEEGLKHLNPEQKHCLELFYLQNKSYVEVAEITGYDLKQVKSYIQNGKRNLRIYMEQKRNA
ncbi:MAG: sigma-70 family RNA polymerase sigma factor [Chitinophagales bacterium]